MPRVKLAPDPQRFPVGTSVGAFRAGSWAPGQQFGAPQGAALETVAVAADGSLTFVTLTAGVEYVGYVGTPDRYLRFTLPVKDTEETQVSSGSTAAAPAGGTLIAGLGGPPKGRYRVQARCWQSGTPDTNLLNATVKRAGSAIHNLPSTSVLGPHDELVIDLDGTQSLQLTTGAAAGGAGAVYNGELLVTRVG